MKIRIGQWFKSPYNNKYVQAQKVNNTEICYSNVFFCLKNQITKVANTPQELIEVGDLVECKGVFHLITNIDDTKYILNNAYHVKKTSTIITKILTPNSNDGFDLQWKVIK
jgi:hypothetical protein